MNKRKERFLLITLLSLLVSVFAWTNSNRENMVEAAQMNDQQAAVVNLAKQQLGKPYVWGAAGPDSFDCSGLMQYVFSHAVGINLPRVTTQQETVGKEVSLNELQPGDILFWGSRGASYHDAVYIGDGNMIQAPEPGDVVKVTALKYYMPDFARRVLPDTPNVSGEGSLDEYSVNQANLKLRGWSASSDSVGKPISYLFALDANTNQELARWKINRTERPDVQRAYPQIAGSLNSGFDENLTIPDSLRGHQVRIMARYTSDPAGDNNASDFTFDQVISIPQVESEGHLDEYNVGQDTLTLRGWSAASNSTDKPISYLFALDANTNQELARWKINRTERPDVQRAYPQIPGSLNSGFDETFKLPDSLKGHQIRILARYTSDPDGNNNASDFTFEQVVNVPK